MRLSNTIDLVMLWEWLDVASAETRLPSLLGLLGLNFCLQLRLPQASTSHQLEFQGVFQSWLPLHGHAVSSASAHYTELILWLSSEEWADHRQLALPDDARSFALF